MLDVAGWVAELSALRAELLDQFGHGRAIEPALHRIAKLSADMASAEDGGNISTPAPDVTPRTAEAYNAILSFYTRHGLSPSIPEMCRAWGINSANGVEYQLAQMESAGLIRRSPKPEGRHRKRPARSIVFLHPSPIPVAS
jgi:hypothetical protein